MIMYVNAIVNYLCVTSVIVALLVTPAWAIVRFMRIRASLYLHMIWLNCLIGIAVVPMLWIYGPKFKVAILPVKSEVKTAMNSMEKSVAVIPVADRAPQTTGTLVQQRPPAAGVADLPRESVQTKRPVFNLKVVLTGLWLTGVVFNVMRLIFSWHFLRRACRSAITVPIGEYLTKIERGMRSITMMVDLELGSPVSFGIFKPIILIPRKIFENSTRLELDLIINHELAHIKRWDCLINAFQRLVETFFFFHPLVWFVSRQLTQERERICDDHVLAGGAKAVEYVNLIRRLVAQNTEIRYLQTIALVEGKLVERVHSLLDPKNSHKIHIDWHARVASICAALLCFTIMGTFRLEARAKSWLVQDIQVGHRPGKNGLQFYVCTDDGRIIGFDGLKRGLVNSLGGANDTSFGQISIGKSVGSIVTATQGVVVGTNQGQDDQLLVYDPDLRRCLYTETLHKPVSSLAAGDLGDVANAVIVGTDLSLQGSWGGDVTVYDSNLCLTANYDLGRPVQDVTLSEYSPTLANRELTIQSKGTDYPTYVNVFSLMMQQNSGLVWSSIWGDYAIDRPSTCVATSDLYTSQGSGDECVIVGVGNSNSPGGVPGGGVIVYRYLGSGSPYVLWDHWVEKIDGHACKAVCITNVDDDPGEEIIIVTDKTVYLSKAGQTSGIPLEHFLNGGTVTSLLVGDVIGRDSIAEIVVGCSNGLILALEHSNPKDLSSPFVLNDQRGGIMHLDSDGDSATCRITGMCQDWSPKAKAGLTG